MCVLSRHRSKRNKSTSGRNEVPDEESHDLLNPSDGSQNATSPNSDTGQIVGRADGAENVQQTLVVSQLTENGVEAMLPTAPPAEIAEVVDQPLPSQPINPARDRLLNNSNTPSDVGQSTLGEMPTLQLPERVQHPNDDRPDEGWLSSSC